ncbi:hypothetical protein GCM10022224_036550 [Nonomuraea antimicrobica]|uniref:DUF4097 domain-containing protein n=1 Tax=Nonomuraea antimicrobica TaxID=561173 RepID=A0ABP7BSW5_9ACTN
MTTSTTRTLSAPIAGPVAFDLTMAHGLIRVTVGGTDRAELTLTTPSPADSPAGKAIAAASLSADVRVITAHVPTPEAGVTIVNHHGGGQVTITDTGGGVIIASGGTMHISGAVIGRGTRITSLSGGNVAAGVTAELRLPAGSALGVSTKTGQVTTSGELEWARFTSTSGDLALDACGKLVASSKSGDIAADVADVVEARTVSGDIRLGRTDAVKANSISGDVAIADFGGSATLGTVSGDITVHATEPGHLTATSTSGDVTVTAPAALAAATGPDALTVNARSVSGDVRTPRPAATTARPRRPRHR